MKIKSLEPTKALVVLTIVIVVLTIALIFIGRLSYENNLSIKNISKNNEFYDFWEATYRVNISLSKEINDFYNDKEKYIIYTEKLRNLDSDICPGNKKYFIAKSNKYIEKINYYRYSIFRQYEDVKYTELLYYIPANREAKNLDIKGWNYKSIKITTEGYKNAANAISGYDSKLFKETSNIAKNLKSINYCPAIKWMTKKRYNLIKNFNVGNNFKFFILVLMEHNDPKLLVDS